MTKAYQDENFLRLFYVALDRDQQEIAWLCDVTKQTISTYTKRYNLAIEKHPWRDEARLRKMYVMNGKTLQEIGDELGTDDSTIHIWVNKFGIKRPYENIPVLVHLYTNRGMTTTEIARRMNCHDETIRERLNDAGVEMRDLKHYKVREPVCHRFNDRGYEMVKNQSGGDTVFVYVHRLIAVAEHGFDAVKDKHIHHKNEIKWDNRPSNLEPMTPSEHSKHHSNAVND